MTDTVESLKAELDALRAEFQTFQNYARPVIDGHQPPNPQPPLFKQPSLNIESREGVVEWQFN